MTSRRRLKALARRQWVIDLDQRHATLQGRLPIYAQAVSICSCGRTSWIMEGAGEDELAEWREDERDHLMHCYEDVGTAPDDDPVEVVDLVISELEPSRCGMCGAVHSPELLCPMRMMTLEAQRAAQARRYDMRR